MGRAARRTIGNRDCQLLRYVCPAGSRRRRDQGIRPRTVRPAPSPRCDRPRIAARDCGRTPGARRRRCGPAGLRSRPAWRRHGHDLRRGRVHRTLQRLSQEWRRRGRAAGAARQVPVERHSGQRRDRVRCPWSVRDDSDGMRRRQLCDRIRFRSHSHGPHRHGPRRRRGSVLADQLRRFRAAWRHRAAALSAVRSEPKGHDSGRRVRRTRARNPRRRARARRRLTRRFSATGSPATLIT